VIFNLVRLTRFWINLPIAKRKGQAIQLPKVKGWQYNSQKKRAGNTIAKRKGHAIQ
jgi:hypothetical protein